MASRKRFYESGTSRTRPRPESDVCAGKYTSLSEKMVPFQKEAQGCPAGSPHGASPALNAFNLSAWMPLQVHPANIRTGNFLFAAIADGGISLVPYPPFRRVGIDNLAFGVEWHRVSLSR